MSRPPPHRGATSKRSNTHESTGRNCDRCFVLGLSCSTKRRTNPNVYRDADTDTLGKFVLHQSRKAQCNYRNHKQRAPECNAAQIMPDYHVLGSVIDGISSQLTNSAGCTEQLGFTRSGCFDDRRNICRRYIKLWEGGVGAGIHALAVCAGESCHLYAPWCNMQILITCRIIP
jgi:hypothetical protein